MEEYLTEVGSVNIITPDCNREDCRVSMGRTTTTAMGWQPMFDRYGNMLNRDPNTSTTQMNCLTCGKTWTRIT